MLDQGLQLVALAPHPPIVIPEVGGQERLVAQKTIDGLHQVAEEIGSCHPETLVVITPHAAIFEDAVTVSLLPTMEGNLGQFGAAKVHMSYQNDLEMAKAIVAKAGEYHVMAAGLNADDYGEYQIQRRLDHGAMVPLYFIDQAKENDFRLVWISIGLLPSDELYACGVAIGEAISGLGRKTVVLVSGDLSHRLTPDAPAGYNPRGQEFDRFIHDAIDQGDLQVLAKADETLAECAGECGLRPIQIGIGVLDGLEVETKVLSYEGPFGVGYMTALLKPVGEAESLLSGLHQSTVEALAQRRQQESSEVKLARQTLENYVLTGKRLPPPRIPDQWQRKAGVFVSLKKKGQLRGCIGTIEPTTDNIATEIMQNAISAGSEDPRFMPVQPEELDQLVYSVDILSPSEPITSIDQLDPHRYGVIVKSGLRSGLLLPNLEGVDTVEEQLSIAKQKAGIRPDQSAEMWRFEVVRYH